MSKAIKWGKASTGRLTEEEETGCVTEYSPHIFMLLIYQHEKALSGLAVGDLLLLHQTTGDKKVWNCPLPLPNSPNAITYSAGDTCYLGYLLVKKMHE